MSYAIYGNFTGAHGADARKLKASIRNRLQSVGGVATRIYRNPYSPERIRYRFIRVHFTKDRT